MWIGTLARLLTCGVSLLHNGNLATTSDRCPAFLIAEPLPKLVKLIAEGAIRSIQFLVRGCIFIKVGEIVLILVVHNKRHFALSYAEVKSS